MKRGVAILGMALTLVYSASADAAIEKKGGYSYVTSKPVSVKPGKEKTVKATCPGKTHVLAGSSLTQAPFNDVTTSIGIPFDGKDDDKTPDDGWIGQASSYADQKIKLSSKAVCSAIKPKYVTESRPADPLSQTSTSVSCERGEAIAGGMLGDVGTNSHFPAGQTWVQFADNYRDKERKIKVAAVCVKDDFDVSSTGNSISGSTPTQGFESCGSSQVGINLGQSNNGGFFKLNTVTVSAFPTGASFALESYSSSTTNFTTYLICNEKLR